MRMCVCVWISEGRGSACFSAPGCCSPPPPPPGLPLRNSDCRSVAGARWRRLPGLRSSISWQLRSLFWHDGKRRKEVKQHDTTSCSVHCLRPRFFFFFFFFFYPPTPPEDKYFYRKESLCFTLIEMQHVWGNTKGDIYMSTRSDFNPSDQN